tara:strand:- start:20213 stop:20560 length:348 start_codon:yes stop_codon:yes gene_type:complete
MNKPTKQHEILTAAAISYPEEWYAQAVVKWGEFCYICGTDLPVYNSRAIWIELFNGGGDLVDQKVRRAVFGHSKDLDQHETIGAGYLGFWQIGRRCCSSKIDRRFQSTDINGIAR